jgi:pyridoxamine 5'-phosphate oxidase
MEPRAVVDPSARIRYAGDSLGDELVGTPPPVSPLALLERWYAEAAADPRIAEPGAMVVATVDSDGRPNARTVLLKALDGEGLVFFTNLASAKARELAADARVALVLPWHPVYRQVRVRGVAEQVSREQAAAYFASRPRDSQVAAWASRQSEPIASRAALVEQVAAAQQRFAGEEQVPLPAFWGGFRVRPVEVELWVGQESRLHDRVVFTSLDGAPADLGDAGRWRAERRQP